MLCQELTQRGGTFAFGNKQKDTMPQMNFTPAIAAEVMALIDDLGLVFTGVTESPDDNNV